MKVRGLAVLLALVVVITEGTFSQIQIMKV